MFTQIQIIFKLVLLDYSALQCWRYCFWYLLLLWLPTPGSFRLLWLTTVLWKIGKQVLIKLVGQHVAHIQHISMVYTGKFNLIINHEHRLLMLHASSSYLRRFQFKMAPICNLSIPFVVWCNDGSCKFIALLQSSQAVFISIFFPRTEVVAPFLQRKHRSGF